MSALACRDIGLSLGGQEILRDVSATFRQGELGAILGPNGAGKSSLMTTLAGLRAADRGKVEIGGADLAGLSPRERGSLIGYLPQSREVHWDLEVRELVALGRLARQGGHFSLSEADRQAVEAAMERTGTTEFARRTISTLSGGEQARVLLARVLAGEPEWILADEPLASLDPAHALQMLSLLREIAHDGTGVVLVMHDLPLAHWAADHLLLLQRGAVAAEGHHDLLQDAALVRSVYEIGIRTMPATGGRPQLVTLPLAGESTA